MRGRKPSLNKWQVRRVRHMYFEEGLKQGEIAVIMNRCRSTIYKYLHGKVKPRER